MLQILAGKRLVSTQSADIRVKGRDVFRDSPPGVTFLGTEWFVIVPNLFLQVTTVQGSKSCGARRHCRLRFLGFRRRVQTQGEKRPSPRYLGRRSRLAHAHNFRRRETPGSTLFRSYGALGHTTPRRGANIDSSCQKWSYVPLHY